MCELERISVKEKLFVLVLCLTVVLSGCKPSDSVRNTMERIAPDDDEALAKKCLTALRARDFDTVTQHLDSQVVKQGIESNLTAAADILDHGAPVSLELVGCNIFSSPGKRRSNLTYQYQFTNAWVLATIIIDSVGETKKVLGINVKPIPKSLGELNAFTFAGKRVQHYLILLLAIAIALFILAVLIICIRTKMRKRKWLWLIFILLGVGKLGLNWTTGQILFNPLSFNIQLFGSAALKQGLYAPWVISISLPLGAIIFLVRRKNLRAIRPPLQQEDTQPTSPSCLDSAPNA